MCFSKHVHSIYSWINNSAHTHIKSFVLSSMFYRCHCSQRVHLNLNWCVYQVRLKCSKCASTNPKTRAHQFQWIIRKCSTSLTLSHRPMLFTLPNSLVHLHPWINCGTSKMIEWPFKIIFRTRMRIPILHNSYVQHSYLITTIELNWILLCLSMSKQQTSKYHASVCVCVFSLAHIEAATIKLCTI